MKKNKNVIISGLVWTFGERICAQLVTTIVTIVLARILDPDHYGIISIVTIIITLLNVFVSCGFGSSLVQNQNSSAIDFDTAFIMSVSLSIVLYILIFFLSPLIERLYNIADLTLVIRVMGIRLIIASINNIQQAFIRKKMEFRKFFWATFVGTLVSGIVGVILAYEGYGVWALVSQYLLNVLIDTIMLFIVGGWYPKFKFSLISAKKIWSFGWKVLFTELVYTLENDIRSLIVGKKFGESELAYYDQGKKYPSLLVTNINASIEKVMLPAYSQQQNNLLNLKITLRKSIRLGLYVLSPILIGFSIVSGSFVRIFLTEKWIYIVPFIQIFCLSYITRPLESSCHQALLAIGKSGVVLFSMIIIHSVSLMGTIIAAFIIKNVLWMALLSLLTTFVSLVVFLSFSKKYINYSFKEQLLDLIPNLSITILMGLFVYLIGLFNINLVVKFFSQIIMGIIIYLFLSIILKNESFYYILNKIKRE